MVFTMQKVEIKKIYAGNLKEEEIISIIQTSGKLNGIETRSFREAPLYEKGEK